MTISTRRVEYALLAAAAIALAIAARAHAQPVVGAVPAPTTGSSSAMPASAAAAPQEPAAGASASRSSAGAGTAAAAAAVPAPVGSDLKPGMIVRADSAARFAQYLPQAARFALAHGFRMQIAPPRRIEWSEGFQRATEKYSPQVELDAEDHIKNYVAGMPFPLINVADPKAAVKIAYNWHLGPVMPDDFSLQPWSSNGYRADPQNPQRIIADSDADYMCEQFDFLRFAHRTEVEPRPTLGSNPNGVEWKAKCNRWTADATGQGTNEGAGIWIRYVAPTHPDEFYGFDELTRRLRRIGSMDGYPNEFCRGCHQPYWAYALPKTERYSYRLLGTTAILACMASADEPAGIKESEPGYALTQEPFELRNAYIVEMTERYPEGAGELRTIIYIDSEIYLWLAAEFYSGGEETAVAMPLWRMRPSSEGGNLFDLAGSFYVPAGNQNFFRSLVPAHTTFTQLLNAGTLSAGDFMPQNMVR